ncbi:MAG: hypothetical protein KAH18_07315 [Psychromonas sp.]|nr:hypothetical protein [Psychromonas sp.]
MFILIDLGTISLAEFALLRHMGIGIDDDGNVQANHFKQSIKPSLSLAICALFSHYS